VHGAHTHFLPLTVDAATGANAELVLHQAVETKSAAAECWLALMASCGSGRRELGSRLSEATSMHMGTRCSMHMGTRWWSMDGSSHRSRVARAQAHIEDVTVRSSPARSCATTTRWPAR
jgi:hypothetical protein